MPIFVGSLIPLLLIALVFFKERLRIREWASLGLIAISVLMVSLSVRSDTVPADEPVSNPSLLAVVVPSLLIPMLLFSLGDRRHDRCDRDPAVPPA